MSLLMLSLGQMGDSSGIPAVNQEIGVPIQLHDLRQISDSWEPGVGHEPSS